MLLCYVDESYTRDHYHSATLVHPDEHALSPTAAPDAVVARAAAGFDGISSEAELHDYDLLQAEGYYETVRRSSA